MPDARFFADFALSCLFQINRNGYLKMAVGDVAMPQMHAVKGVKIGSAEAYVRYPNRRDLVIFEFAEGYKRFLNIAKTEREFVNETMKVVEAQGFINAEKLDSLKIGDKIYYLNRGKNIVLVVVGKEEIEKGVNFVVSHADVPRLDLKGNPLYAFGYGLSYTSFPWSIY